MTSGSARPLFSVSGVCFRDLSWESALRALPPPLLAALRAERLDDPGFLCEYPRDDALTTGEKLGGSVAPSGAASSGQRPTSSLPSSITPLMSPAMPSGSISGASLVGDPGFVDSGAVSRASLFGANQMSEVCVDSPLREGELATQTAKPDLLDLPASVLSVVPVHSDGLPNSGEIARLTPVAGPVRVDGFSCEEVAILSDGSRITDVSSVSLVDASRDEGRDGSSTGSEFKMSAPVVKGSPSSSDGNLPLFPYDSGNPQKIGTSAAVSTLSLADRVLIRKFSTSIDDISMLPDGRHDGSESGTDGSMPDGRHDHTSKAGPARADGSSENTGSELRDGSSGLNAVDEALLRRFGPSGAPTLLFLWSLWSLPSATQRHSCSHMHHHCQPHLRTETIRTLHTPRVRVRHVPTPLSTQRHLPLLLV